MTAVPDAGAQAARAHEQARCTRVAEQRPEVADVGVVPEQESGHVAEPEVALPGLRRVPDVVVGHGALRGDDAAAG
jgi:hypothetical protein